MLPWPPIFYVHIWTTQGGGKFGGGTGVVESLDVYRPGAYWLNLFAPNLNFHFKFYTKVGTKLRNPRFTDFHVPWKMYHKTRIRYVLIRIACAHSSSTVLILIVNSEFVSRNRFPLIPLHDRQNPPSFLLPPARDHFRPRPEYLLLCSRGAGRRGPPDKAGAGRTETHHGEVSLFEPFRNLVSWFV